MKKHRTPHRIMLTLACGALAAQAACSTSAPDNRARSPAGPTVLNAHTEPGTFELNPSLEPYGSTRIVADVKDFNAPVKEVRLRFTSVPIDIPMQNIGGTTWAASLTPQQLQELAVRGKTIDYDAEVTATDDATQARETTASVTIAVKAPESAIATG